MTRSPYGSGSASTPVAFVPLLLHRLIWPIWITCRHQPEVNWIERETDDTYSLYVRGRDFDKLPMRAGQFFIVRALTGRDWMHGHPFSISSAPNGQTIRFTVKESAQGRARWPRSSQGTPLMLEGPYGDMHGARRAGAALLFIGAGIGITPLRAMAEAFPFAPGEADMIFRARSEPTRHCSTRFGRWRRSAESACICLPAHGAMAPPIC